MQPRRALIIEDDERARAALAAVLHGVGYRVALAENGAVGVALAVAEPPDVITLDLRMPVMDGWTTAVMLKSNPRTAGVPVLAISWEDFDGRSRAMLEPIGFCAFLRKPVRPTELVAAVELCLTHAARGASWVELDELGDPPTPANP
jgi:CheY-like chemotaxis protein